MVNELIQAIVRKIFVILLVIPHFVFSQCLTMDSLNMFIAKQVRDYKIPGLAIGIIQNDSVIFKHGYGMTSTSAGLPVTTQTVFPISSCTKAFTAAAIGILVDEGKLSWNDKVIKYLSDFKMSTPWITKELTISDILSHRSGLATYVGDLLWYGTDYTRDQIINKIQYLPIRNNFRVDFGYSNLMYLLAAKIIERVSGQTWEQFIKEKLLIPLSMLNTSIGTTQMEEMGNYALPHLQDKPFQPVNMDNIAPAGGINSNIDDLMKWVKMWIGNGRIGNNVIINTNPVETITSIKTLTSASSDNGYGFGWFIKYQNGQKIIYHDGGMPGYKSNIIILPKSGDAIVILTNKISPLNDQLINVILNYLANSKKINWAEADKNMFFKDKVYRWDKKRNDGTKLKSFIPHIVDYTGVYEDAVYGKAIIKQEKIKATLTLLPAKKLFTGTLYYLAPKKLEVIFKDVFISPGEIIFDKKNNRIYGFKMNIPTNDFHFENLYFKKRTPIKP